MTSLPTGTVTFLFTDIEGSTKLWQEYPDQMKVNLARHDELLRQSIEHNEGYVFKTVGDAFCAAFPTALQGVTAAVESQQALSQENWGECVIKVRMGLHTGDAEERDNDYFGNTLNRVARLMSAGHGGQVLLSQSTQELVSNNLPEDATLRDLGKHRLKDLIHPEHIFQLDVKNLPTYFPALKTLDILLNNLPTQLTPFIGRDRETAAVLRLLRTPEIRLVTLTGPGGTGKTRLSLEVAAGLLGEYEHGVWFVELASITDPELCLPTIAATLKVKETGETSIAQTLHEYLRGKNLLLVLDNFEQIVSAAPAISGLLNATPKVKVLVSSREILHLRGENGYQVPPLGLPESGRKQTAAVLAQYEAIALFVQHAQAVNPSFVLDEDNASIIAEICMKLDGLPLALELAAARARVLKPAVILEKLKKSLDTLTGGARDLPRRQQTIRGAINWSYELLDESDKTLFSRLSVFVGGWTVESAEFVCGAGLSVDILHGIEALLDKSLIRQFEGTSGETRFTMLETIREYAHEKLSQSGELPGIRQAHITYIEQFLHKIASASRSEEGSWFARLDDNFGNVRDVIEWTLTQQQPSIAFKAGNLWEYWYQRTNYREPLIWLERGLVLDQHGASSERARALSVAGNLLSNLGECQRAAEYHEAALNLYRTIGNANGIATCLNNLGEIALIEKDIEKARQLFEQVLEIYPDGNSELNAWGTWNLGNVAMKRGHYQEARDYYIQARESLARMSNEAAVTEIDWCLGILEMGQRNLSESQAYFQQALKANWLKAVPLTEKYIRGYLGYVQLLSGNKKDASMLLAEALEAAVKNLEQRSGDSAEGRADWILLDGKARLELMAGKAERAAQLFGAAWKQRDIDVTHLTLIERAEHDTCMAEIRSIIGKAAFEVEFQKGHDMKVKEVLMLALEETQ